MCIQAGALDLLLEWFESRIKMVRIAFGNKFENGFEIKEKKNKKKSI